MNYLLRKLGFFFLGILKPIFNFFKKQKPHYFEKLRECFTDPYFSGMLTRFNLWHEWIFKPTFEKIRLDPLDIEKIKALSQEGTLVYVMKNRGQLEYSFFNHRFLKDGLPLAHFANGSRSLYWRPFRDIVRATLFQLDYYYTQGLVEDPIQSDYLENLVVSGKSALLNLNVSRDFLFGANEDPVEFIPPLIKAAQKSEKPVYLITQQFIHDKHPDKAHKGWFDFFLGEKKNPGMIRKMLRFIRRYGKRATVKIGEPFDLKVFVDSNPNDDPKQLASKLKGVLLERLHIELKSITGPALQSQAVLLDKMLRNKQFKQALDDLALEQQTERVDLEKRVEKIYYEMAADVNYSYVAFYDRLIRWITNNIYSGLDIDTQGLSKIKAIAGNNPVILVPSHRSHIDYLLLSYLFYNYDLTLPFVCAGINLKFWPVSLFIKRGGGFFIRRRMKGDKLYKLVLESYIKLLVREGYSFEFFIEGTRSRTGKLLQPKMGILAMLMNAYLDGSASDLYFVPLSMTYERILEAKSYVSELQGAEKQKENMRSMMQFRKKFGKKYGKVFIRFAEPISLKAFVKDKGLDPSSLKSQDYRQVVSEFAYHLTYHINRVTVVIPTSLVAMSLLTFPKKGVPHSLIVERCSWLQRYLEYKEAGLSSIIRKMGSQSYVEALQKLTQEKMINLHRDFHEEFYTLEENKRSLIDYHKNNSIHFFVSLVCFSKLLMMTQKDQVQLSELLPHYEVLKGLLRHEFTFSSRKELKDHIVRILDFYEQQGIVGYDEESETITLMNCKQHEVFQFYLSLLDNFFESIYISLAYLKYIEFEPQPSKVLCQEIGQKGYQLYLKGDLFYPEAFSASNIKNALSVLKDSGLLQTNEKGFMVRTFDEDIVDRWEKLLVMLLGESSYMDHEPIYYLDRGANDLLPLNHEESSEGMH